MLSHPVTETLAATRVMDQLRSQISGLSNKTVRPQPGLHFGVPAIDAALPPGGLAPVALHEFVAGSNIAPSAGLLCALLSQRPGPVVWIVDGWRPYPPGLAAFGLKIDSVIYVEARREAERLWAMEEALRTPGLAGVVSLAVPDLTATRRLQLASEKSGTPGFLLRRAVGDLLPSSACTTRWRVAAAPSEAPDSLPGLGPPRWRIELLKARGGRPGQWVVEWRDKEFVVPASVMRANSLPNKASRDDGQSENGKIAVFR